MSLISLAEETAANAIVPGSGIALRIWRWIKPAVPWLLLAAGIASALWAIERHGETRGRGAVVVKYQPRLDRALKLELAATATIGRLRGAIDKQNAATIALARAEAEKLRAAHAAVAEARKRDVGRLAMMAKLAASAVRQIPGAPCDASSVTKEAWK